MGSGFKTFNSGDVLTAAQVQGYLQDQAVMYFANATARDAAVTSPTEGMACYLADTNYFQLYDGSAWSNVINTSGVPAGGGQKQLVTFTSSGTFTKASYSNYSQAEITVVGGGGAGGGAEGLGGGDWSVGSGGGAGGTAVIIVPLASMAASETVTIGAGGTGVAAADGGNGGTTSFGTWAVATGGTGGNYLEADFSSIGQGYPGGTGGIGTTGTLLMQGGAGRHCWVTSQEYGYSGGGGLSSFGGSGAEAVNDPAATDVTYQGAAGPVPGAGGDGSAKTHAGSDLPGGDGADGIVVVKLT